MRTLIRYAATAYILALLSIVMITPTTGAIAVAIASEKPCAKHICGSLQENSIVIDGVIRQPGQSVKAQARPRVPGSGRAIAAAAFEYRRSQVCGGQGFVPEGGTACATAGCADAAATRFITARRSVDGPAGAPWAQVGDGCIAPGAPAAAGAPPAAQVSDVIATEFAQLPLTGATAQVQPAEATLVNVQTVFFTDPGVQVFNVVILGQPVTVTATPTAYTWVFGDGATLGPSTSPGAPWPNHDITHIYAQPGRVQARVDVSWTGTFAVAGGPPAPIPGQVTIQGPEVEVLIREARSQLVATPRT